MLDVILKRFEKPDEVRTFEKRQGRNSPPRWNDWPCDVLTGLEMVATCWSKRWKKPLRHRTCGIGCFGLRHGRDRGPRSDRNESGRPVLRPSRPAWTRQLGSRRRAVRVVAFSGCQRLRDPEALDAIVSDEWPTSGAATRTKDRSRRPVVASKTNAVRGCPINIGHFTSVSFSTNALIWMVARGRIELPTRGFSVRCSTN